MRGHGDPDEPDEGGEADQQDEPDVRVSQQGERRHPHAVAAAVRAGVRLDVAYQSVKLLVGHHIRERRTGNVDDVSRWGWRRGELNPGPSMTPKQPLRA